MGYRSTFVTEDLYVPIPDWFIEKWKEHVHFGRVNYEGEKVTSFPVSSKHEWKFYSGAEEDLFVDLAQVLRECKDSYVNTLVLALMHEDGLIDRVIIKPDKISLEGNLNYDKDDCYNPNLGDRNDTHHLPLKESPNTRSST